jgi:hypothetical protein
VKMSLSTESKRSVMQKLHLQDKKHIQIGCPKCPQGFNPANKRSQKKQIKLYLMSQMSQCPTRRTAFSLPRKTTSFCVSNVPMSECDQTLLMFSIQGCTYVWNTHIVTQPCSARLTPWKAPPTRLAQQYQNHIAHFERCLKAIFFQAQQYQKYVAHFERDVKVIIPQARSGVGTFYQHS